MTDAGQYVPSPTRWVRGQVDLIDAAGDTSVVDIMGLPVVLLTMIGASSGAIRKVPLMRVEHEGAYLAVASKGGDATNPQWYANLKANPDITLQDGTQVMSMRARELAGEERATWWERAVAAFPTYAGYQRKTERVIPILLLEPVPEDAA